MTQEGSGIVTVADFKVHPSALASTGTGSQTMAPSQSMTALAAAQHAAALASQDTQASDDDDPPAGCFLDLVSRSLPLLLTAGIVYIYYVYTFRVCLDYILRIQHNETLAYIYLGVFNTFTPPMRRPMPPVPPTTTPFQPQRMAKMIPRPMDETFANTHSNDIPDTTPLLRTTKTKAGSYQSISRTASSGKENVSINIGSRSHEETPIATLNISKRDGRPRWCDICKIVKPDRCHHCSECDQCVLRMDHHCPWVNGCIGYNNHKFFYLFIFYGSVLAIWVVATMIPLLISAFRSCEQDFSSKFASFNTRADLMGGCYFDFHWPLITVISLLLALMIISFTVAHTAYILQNRTTIESLQDVRSTYIRVQYRKQDDSVTVASLGSNDGLASSSSTVVVPPGPDFNVVLVQQGEQLWDRGSWYANWKSIMGPSWWLWFVPYGNTMGDGIHDVYNDKVYQRIVSEALAQARAQSGGLVLNDEHRVTFNVAYSEDGHHHRYEYLHSRGTPAVHSHSTGIRDRITHELYLDTSHSSPVYIDHSAEDSEASVGSMGRSLPTPHSSPRFAPLE
ncbi:palmitoyltransferase for Vac8p [Podila epicladia]|nr:palmitoyltransferase for Vac8p [Podila epicladia]